MQYLIIGLGNVGEQYDLTRHNVGFKVLDHLIEQQGEHFRPARLALLAAFRYRGRSINLIKPTTYMNHSGKAVRYWLNQLKLPAAHSLVVVDDVALPFGKLRMRMQGSSAGHNGLESVEEYLGTQAYPRLRVGVGRDFAPGQQAAYVLAPFTTQERTALPMHFDQACEMILAFCTVGISRTMTQYN